jgi:hypothetical protein
MRLSSRHREEHIGKNKAKGKAQKANGKTAARTAIIQECHFWGYIFAFCPLRFAF